MSFQLNLNAETVDQCHPAEPLCIAPGVSMREALQQMRELNRGVVLVCDSAKIIGIFTERDALKMMAVRASLDGPLRQFMTPDPVVLHATDVVGKAISMMTHGGYRRLPIVDDLGKPTGIITAEGIMHYLAEHFPSVIYNLPPEPHYRTQQREGA
ncbi:MAG: cyclic nucleotide-binding/CBS domain-containing protein [Pirellulales bacterium]